MKTSFHSSCILLFTFVAVHFTFLQSPAQVNLVPNPGFETFITCPVGFSSFNGYVSDWNNPSAASPDYMNACATPFPAGAPTNGTGYQVPHSGNGYAGAYLTGGIYKEYIQIHLSTPLVAGNLYDFKMYVVLHNKSQTASDDIGAYFSVTAPVSAGTGYLNGNPVAQVSNTPGNVITDTLNWTLISGSYAATGGEQYITLGHFKTDGATTYLTVNYGSQGTYYYFDDVSLTSSTSLPVELLSFDATCGTGPETVISWSTASELNVCCFDVEKGMDAVHFETVARVKAAGNTDQKMDYRVTDLNAADGAVYYRLKQTDENGTNSYSPVVAFLRNHCHHPDAVPGSFFQGHELTFFNCPDVSSFELYNATGRKVYEAVISDPSSQLTFHPAALPGGVYVARLFDKKTKRTITLKVISMQ